MTSLQKLGAYAGQAHKRAAHASLGRSATDAASPCGTASATSGRRDDELARLVGGAAASDERRADQEARDGNRTWAGAFSLECPA